MAEEREDGALSPDEENVTGPGGKDMEAAEEGEALREKTDSEKLAEINDKYLRLYAEFENYRKRVARDREELLKYASEPLVYEILPSLDSMEIALKHADDEASGGLVEGVRNTLREVYRKLENFGLSHIEAEGKPFDPEYHHAISQVERDDIDEQMVVEELRKGFKYHDKVLRASLVTVSRKPSGEGGAADEQEGAGISEKKEDHITMEDKQQRMEEES